MSTVLSKVRNNAAFKYYKFKNRRNSKSWIVALVLNLLGLPMMYIAQNIFYSDKLRYLANNDQLIYQYENNVSIFIGIGVFCVAIAVIAGVFTVFSVFDYMYNKSLVDMAYSAPLGGTARYTADFLSGLTIYLSPYLIGGIIGFILGGLTNLRIEEEFRLMPDFGTILPIFLGVGVAMIMAYALTAFVSICCGSLIEAVTYALILNGIIPIAIAVTVFGAMNNIYGIFQEQLALDLITVTSPLGVLAGTLGNVFDAYEESAGHFIYQARNLIPIILITAAAIVGAFLLNRRRKAEDCGKPFVFKVLYYILISAVTYCIITAHFSATVTKVSVASALIMSAVIYFILEVISNRGFRRFWVTAIRYTVTAAIIMLVVGPFVRTKAFGLFYKVPNVNSVRSVELSYTSNGYYNQESIKVMYKDKEAIADIASYHELVLKNHLSEDDKDPYYEDIDEYGYYKYDYYNYERDFSQIGISYKMKNGTTINRSYYGNDGEYDLIKHLEESNEFKEASIKLVEKNLTNIEQIFLIDEINEDINENINSIMVKDKGAKQLLEAIAKDIRAGENIFRTDKSTKILGMLNVHRTVDDMSYPWTMDITENHINTISYFTQKGYSSFFAADKDRFPNADTGLYNIYLINTDEFLNAGTDIDGGLYNLIDLIYHDIVHVPDNQIASARGLVVNDKVRELVSKLEQVEFESPQDYLVKFGSKLFAVPEEYNSLAEEIFSSDVAIDPEKFYKLLNGESSVETRDFIEGVLK